MSGYRQQKHKLNAKYLKAENKQANTAKREEKSVFQAKPEQKCRLSTQPITQESDRTETDNCI